MFSATTTADHRRISPLIRKFSSSRITSQVDTDRETRISGGLSGIAHARFRLSVRLFDLVSVLPHTQY